MIYTDAHCHITPNTQNPDIACRIYNAARPADWENAIMISETDDDKNFAAVGIHPWYITDVEPEFESKMVNILSEHPNMMVGEIGLDKFHPDMPRQIEILNKQLDIATTFRRPVHMHCVGAWDKILHIFRERGTKMPPAIVAHCFTGDTAQIQMMADKYNMYFSYPIPHENGTDMARITATPENRILTETDTNNPIEEIEKLDAVIGPIAAAHQCNIEEMSEKIYQNIQRVISYVRPIA